MSATITCPSAFRYTRYWVLDPNDEPIDWFYTYQQASENARVGDFIEEMCNHTDEILNRWEMKT